MEWLRRALRGSDLPVGEALHPVTLACVLLLVVNDWVLKRHWPGVVTGKLSDIAGLVFAPLVLSGVIGLILRKHLSHARLIVCIAITGAVFTATKLSPGAAELLARMLSVVRPAYVVPDPTDLIALPALAVAYWIGRDELRIIGH